MTTKLKAAFSTYSNQDLSRDIVPCVVQRVIVFITSHRAFHYFHPISYASCPKGEPAVSRREEEETRPLVFPLKRQCTTFYPETDTNAGIVYAEFMHVGLASGLFQIRSKLWTPEVLSALSFIITHFACRHSIYFRLHRVSKYFW